FTAVITPHRKIAAIESEPERPALSRLVGERGGGGLRQMLEQIVPDEKRNATPLYLILDDISGTSLVCPWAWFHWNPNWREEAQAFFKIENVEQLLRKQEGVCAGLASDSSAFDPNQDRSGAPAPDLRNPQDPDGWHAFTAQTEIGMRRARRID